MDALTAQIREELERIIPIVEELTELPSHWNGIAELIPDAEYRGRKPFSCSIVLDATLAEQPERWATLIHEALHAVSAGYIPTDFRDFRGWEEGVVEQLQRLWRPAILARLNVSVDDTLWQVHEAAHRFNDYINALEEIRQTLQSDTESLDAVTFYSELLRTPIRERPGYVLSLGYQREGLPRTPFVRAFSAANAILTRKLL